MSTSNDKDDVVKQATRIVELKEARDEAGPVGEFVCQVMNKNLDGVKQDLIKLAHDDPSFRDLIIKRSKKDWQQWMKEHSIPFKKRKGGKHYSLAHILDAYGISPLKFCENFGLHYKALLESGMTYFMTIEEMWDRDIYPVYLKKVAKDSVKGE